MSRIALFGATSEIGGEIMTRIASGNDLVLAARRPEALGDLVASCEKAGARSVETVFFDASDCPAQSGVIDSIENQGPIDTAIATFGVLGDQGLAERDGGEVERVLHTDFTAQAVLLTELSDRMKSRGAGTLVAFSSIAGARVRRPNYVYGSAKAGLDGFCQGMQDALRGTGVTLTVVRPGFVIGQMTEGMDPAPMSVTADVVAEATVDAINRGTRDVWVPRRLGLLATATTFVPRWLWRMAPR
ncbi:MAG TPA: SDR family NAD(P)-dependent oxidoreductase [Candidatus Corynebacterium avicola]|uniref:SDR family NAD(P)-dependent oxidoreductase n=1 Tax=Candidatus Corynebacterium avicola TaxID=2838527 RepID=A0A9D1RQ76_9CORY|nr:SDR family NAD(P)-dependent oxidoreductase [Candidatus Corynebacterium avicola]